MKAKITVLLLALLGLALGLSACQKAAEKQEGLAQASSEIRKTGAKEVETRNRLRLKLLGRFQGPVWMTQAPGDNAFYVVEQEGRIIRKEGGVQETWLDISEEVASGGEQGLLSLAFSPDYQENGLFYFYYTANNGKQIVAEGIYESGQASKKRNVLVMNDFASNHNGGQISFGPGGLYIATGDGGGSGDPERTALNPRSLLGKILRIIPYQKGEAPYSIPRDNPYFSSTSKKREIFSLGLRNPWRFSIGAGRIWIADVGQNEQEEVSAPRLSRARGGNFGWSAWEGRLPYNDDQRARNPIWPLLVYGRDRGCSITGGYWMKELAFTRNRYFYSDFCQGQIRSFRLKDGRARGDRSERIRVAQPVSFARTRSGQLYVISLGGAIYQIT